MTMPWPKRHLKILKQNSYGHVLYCQQELHFESLDYVNWFNNIRMPGLWKKLVQSNINGTT